MGEHRASPVAEPPAMSRSSAVGELSLRDYKFYAKLVPLCFAVSVLRTTTTTTTTDRQMDGLRSPVPVVVGWMLTLKCCASLFPCVVPVILPVRRRHGVLHGEDGVLRQGHPARGGEDGGARGEAGGFHGADQDADEGGEKRLGRRKRTL